MGEADGRRATVRSTVGPADLSGQRRIHVVGAGGAGMSAIATVLAAMGHQVTGSDLRPSAALDRLAALGVGVAVGHHPDLARLADLVVVSTAIPHGDPEVRAAEVAGVRVCRRAEALAGICAARRTVAVAGTHGKTTTASMLAVILDAAGWRPSYLIGGTITGLGAGAAWQDGPWLVVEADESDGTFLELPAEAVVVTSVEPDHLEHYGGEAAMRAAFAAFVAAPTGPRLVCADEPGSAGLASTAGVASYGTAAGADWRMVDVAACDRGAAMTFGLERDGTLLGPLQIAAPGVYNARNACAAAAAAMAIGVPFAAVAAGLARFGGVGRRFEHRGERDGITFVDDYGHLPGEVQAVLAGARPGPWTRTVAVFQPHRYSRTAALWPSFADAFVDADVVVVTGIYASDESPRPGISGRLVADAVRQAHPDQEIHYVEARRALIDLLHRVLRPGDLCLTLGAGDLTTVPDALLGER